jgi:hypothetical protein
MILDTIFGVFFYFIIICGIALFICIAYRSLFK